MIKDKTIYFGYGDIAISFDRVNTIIFQSCRQLELGSIPTQDDILPESEYKGIYITNDIKGYWYILTLLMKVNESNPIVRLPNDLTLDFTMFSLDSLFAVIDSFNRMIYFMTQGVKHDDS